MARGIILIKIVHNKLNNPVNDNVNGSHPNILKIIEIFQKQQAQNEIQIQIQSQKQSIHNCTS